MTKGLLSVVVPTCGRNVEVLGRAVASILAQTYQPIEVVLVDDNCDDSVLSGRIRNYCHDFPKVKYVQPIANSGACAARNRGIECSAGEFIGFLDDDDAWEANKAELQIATLKDDIYVSFCRGRCIDEAVFPSRITPYYNANFFRPIITFEDMLLNDCIGTTSQVIMRKEALTAVGGFDEKMQARQDYELWIRVSHKFQCAGVDESLFTHYMHSGIQISKDPKRALQGYKHIYTKHKRHYKVRPAARKNIIRHIIGHAWNAGNLRDMIIYGFVYACAFPETIGKLVQKA
jgi:glycosyltransferase involved in cell wall biosynthesis